MKFVFAPDSFKGTLTSLQVAEILTKEARKIFDDVTTVSVQIADGGEGTLETLVDQTKGEYIRQCVLDPLGREIESGFGKLYESTAIIEMAKASGLPLLKKEERNPLRTSTYGTGQLIRAALDQNFRHIYIALGGSATNDGGMGALAALGVRFLDDDGAELEPAGENLIRIRDLDTTGLHPGVAGCKFTLICDVKNPLVGADGATYVFGRQKGATDVMLDELERGMLQYASVVESKYKVKIREIPGGGAAGGIGAALHFFLNAQIKPGIETILDMLHFDELLEGADLVVTGEGKLDWQSAFGKVPSGVGLRCKQKNIPAVALVGAVGRNASDIYDYGIDTVFTSVSSVTSEEEVMAHAQEMLEDAANRMFRCIQVGMKIR
ncbi:glycerate kinase family protein [Diplocloster modestus]|uniref:Glycerate kinase n=1 Tax=Diplocloster modestus TaxID=2850322 RepID=A0ABS6K7D4_9FIRM|nr:glycerate kinase [Diplocloster modestus]MBU9726423.1 glycerate kinase [Diplocloster modestus]